MPNVFTYGALMFDPVWSRIVANGYDRCDAILRGYERKGVRDEVYPVVVPSSEYSQVRGVVYLDVSPSDLIRLDQFEGEYYLRKKVMVATEEEGTFSAEVFILKEEYYAVISPEEWDPVHFSTTGIHYFLHHYMKTEEQ